MRSLVLLVALLAAAAAPAQEILISTTPLPQRATEAPAAYHLTELRLRLEPPEVAVRLEARRGDGACARDARGDCQALAVSYQGAEAAALLDLLNTANLSSRSLRRRVIERLQADGHLPAGNIAGSASLATATSTATPTGTATSTATRPPEATATASHTAAEGKGATPAP